MALYQDQVTLLTEFVQVHNLGDSGLNAISPITQNNDSDQSKHHFITATSNLAQLVTTSPEVLTNLFDNYFLFCDLIESSTEPQNVIYSVLRDYYKKYLLTIKFTQDKADEDLIAKLSSLSRNQLEEYVESYIESKFVRNLLEAKKALMAHIAAVEAGEEGPQRDFILRHYDTVKTAITYLAIFLFVCSLILLLVMAELLDFPFLLFLILPIGYGLNLLQESFIDKLQHKLQEFLAEIDDLKNSYSSQIEVLDTNIKASVDRKFLFFSDKTPMNAPEMEVGNSEMPILIN